MTSLINGTLGCFNLETDIHENGRWKDANPNKFIEATHELGFADSKQRFKEELRGSSVSWKKNRAKDFINLVG